jgi:hypothetical protein
MRKIFALLIGILVFLPLAFTAMSLTSLRPWILDRGFYERLVSDERLYDGLFIGQINNVFNRNIFTTEQIPVAALNAALREVITPEYMQAQSVAVVGQVFDFIDGRDGSYEAMLNFTTVKAAFSGEAGTRFANTLAAALPACEAGQDAIAPEGTFVRCIAADSSPAEAAEQIANALPGAVETLPNFIDATDTDIRVNWPSVNWLVRFSVRPGYDIGMIAAVFAALIAGLSLAYLGGDNRRERLLWLGSWLFFPAALFVLIGLALTSPFLEGPLRNGLMSASWDGVNFSETFQQGIMTLATSLVQQIGSGFLLTGAVSTIIALTLVVLGLLTTSTAADYPSGKTVQVPVRTI